MTGLVSLFYELRRVDAPADLFRSALVASIALLASIASLGLHASIAGGLRKRRHPAIKRLLAPFAAIALSVATLTWAGTTTMRLAWQFRSGRLRRAQVAIRIRSRPAINGMTLDFSAALVIAVVVTGTILLVDRTRSASDRSGTSSDRAAAALRLLVSYAHSFFPIILIVLLFRSFLFEPFSIPSASMMPGLVDGDFIVDKFSYGLRLPWLNTKIAPIGKPRRGEVIVFARLRALRSISSNDSWDSPGITSSCATTGFSLMAR